MSIFYTGIKRFSTIRDGSQQIENEEMSTIIVFLHHFRIIVSYVNHFIVIHHQSPDVVRLANTSMRRMVFSIISKVGRSSVLGNKTPLREKGHIMGTVHGDKVNDHSEQGSVINEILSFLI